MNLSQYRTAQFTGYTVQRAAQEARSPHCSSDQHVQKLS